MIQKGELVPNFKLKNQDGNDFEFKDHLGKGKIVLYFYPKDETTGCIMEACAFRDSYEAFIDAGAKVIGISSDSIESHRNFASKYNLPFTLLSDTENKVRKLFGIPKTFGLIPGRVTFVIDENGIVLHIFNSQLQARKHIREAIHIICDG